MAESARKWSRNTSISRKIPRHGMGMLQKPPIWGQFSQDVHVAEDAPPSVQEATVVRCGQRLGTNVESKMRKFSLGKSFRHPLTGCSATIRWYKSIQWSTYNIQDLRISRADMHSFHIQQHTLNDQHSSTSINIDYKNMYSPRILCLRMRCMWTTMEGETQRRTWHDDLTMRGVLNPAINGDVGDWLGIDCGDVGNPTQQFLWGLLDIVLLSG